MTPFQRSPPANVTPEELKAKYNHIKHYPDEEWVKQAQRLNEAQIWLNDTYQVQINHAQNAFIHLSVKRIDKEPIREWRDLQEIKNIFVGEETEAVELYPAESRLVDSANQYHLWVHPEPGFKWPFGFGERLVMDGTGAIEPEGYRQQPFKEKKS